MKRQYARIALLLLLLLLFPACLRASAHPGHTDAQGGHYDRSTGEYHFHHGYPAHQHENGVCPYDFDNKTGSNSGSSSSGSKNTPSNTVPYTEPTTGMETTRPREDPPSSSPPYVRSTAPAPSTKKSSLKADDFGFLLPGLIIAAVIGGNVWLHYHEKNLQERRRQQQEQLRLMKEQEAKRKHLTQLAGILNRECQVRKKAQRYMTCYTDMVRDERLFLNKIGRNDLASLDAFVTISPNYGIEIFRVYFLTNNKAALTPLLQAREKRRRVWQDICDNVEKELHCPPNVKILPDGSVQLTDCTPNKPYGAYTGYLSNRNKNPDLKLHIKYGCHSAFYPVNILYEKKLRMQCSVCCFGRSYPSTDWCGHLSHLLMIGKRYKQPLLTILDNPYPYQYHRYDDNNIVCHCEQRCYNNLFELVADNK